jgi:hypothetical protein
MERGLLRIPLNLERGVEFFARHESRPSVMGAARFEPESPAEVAHVVS